MGGARCSPPFAHGAEVSDATFSDVPGDLNCLQELSKTRIKIVLIGKLRWLSRSAYASLPPVSGLSRRKVKKLTENACGMIAAAWTHSESAIFRLAQPRAWRRARCSPARLDGKENLDESPAAQEDDAQPRDRAAPGRFRARAGRDAADLAGLDSAVGLLHRAGPPHLLTAGPAAVAQR